MKEIPDIILTEQQNALSKIDALDFKLSQHFNDKFIIQRSLTRQLVSFQANKTIASYRWYKYKEAFSAPLVGYLLSRYGIESGKILDPFAGSGTTLFAASCAGMDVDGIELLPIGDQIIAARLCLDREFTTDDFTELKRWLKTCPWKESHEKYPLLKLRITDGAYSAETSDAIERYIGALQKENERVRLILRFALLCILESISFTRKDGQYLRWDYRSEHRKGGKTFNKGEILNFDQAIYAKIEDILHDMKLGNEHLEKHNQGNIHLFQGSCLDIMPELPFETYNAIVTSPPYCNRYDYTRTYALELALLGVNEKELINLRQQMLSCTVENRAKDLLAINPRWAKAIEAADQQELLQSILQYLDDQKAQGKLNNSGIPRMVRGYFYEMACIIAECSRVMKQNAYMFMVNDNVRYAGASVSVDMILSDIAEKLGFYVENILVLPNGKGNSSQQMGEHGRDSLRKCVYIWRKI
ncbi:MAG: DNA modification methylase [Candidatus Methanoperedenaceae archaeon HGW-Methanoperedenaceae-1]|nr:MAG: DNA modification methylase [Candidatus Methanoperedenaceae archaeon HGW-Methanoperedenaceae-1]